MPQNVLHRIAPDGPAPPRVWVLVSNRAGDDAQSRLIADALGWPTEVKQMAFAGYDRFRYRLLGPSLASVDRTRSVTLEPPWPDLVVSAGRRQIPIAFWIREQSGGRTRLVELGRPQAAFERFDLIVGMPQFRLPEHPNLMPLTLPLMRGRGAEVTAAVRAWAPRLAHLPRPWTALLVGGPAKPFAFDAAAARRLAAEAAAFAEPGSLLVTTSPRTPPEVAAGLAETLPAGTFLHVWRQGQADNPYPALLGLADRFVVTNDSISMMTEVARSGRPLAIYCLPRNPKLGPRPRVAVAEMLARTRGRWAERLADCLNSAGLVYYPRDLRGFTEKLIAAGFASRFPDPPPLPATPPDELSDVVRRIRAMFGR